MAEANNGKKAIKAGFGYTIGNFMIRGISFLLVMVFSRIMKSDQFGVYNIFLSYDSILYVVTGFALHSSVKSANLTFKKQIDQYISTMTLVYVFNFVLFNIIVTLFGRLFSELTELPVLAIYMLLFYSSGSALLTLYNERLSLDYNYKKFLTLSCINTVCSISLSLVLMYTVYSDNLSLGRIIGSSVTIAAIAVYILFAIYRKAKPKFNKEYLKFGFKYSLPIVPHGISQVLLSQFDRIMIEKMISFSAAGIYSLAANLNLILNVICTSIETAWNTWFFEEMDAGHTKVVQKRAKQLTTVALIMTIGLMGISPEMMLILGGSEYAQGKYVAIPLIIDAFVIFIYDVVVSSEYYTKKTKYIMIGTMIAAAINVVTNYIFIKKFGFYAAAYTTLFSYLCYAGLHMFISHRLIKFHVIPMKSVLFYIVMLAVSAYIDLTFIDSIWIRYPVFAATIGVIGYFLYKELSADGIDVIGVIKSRFKK